MNEKMSTVALGVLLKKVYPCVKSKSERLKADWSKKERVYYGISWREQPNEAEHTSTCTSNDFHSILQICTMNQCFLISKENEEISVGLFTGDIVNGNRITAEIKFKKDLTWTVRACGRVIDSVKLGIANQYSIVKQSIESVIDTVKNFKFCTGITSDTILNNQDYFKEVWSKSGDENSAITVSRSKSCVVILPYTSRNSTCHKCSKLLKHNESGHKDTNEKLIVDVPNIQCDHVNNDIIQVPNIQCDKVDSENCKKDDKNEEESDVVLSESDHTDFSLIHEKSYSRMS